MIALKNVSISYGNNKVISELSGVFSTGKITYILGGNGAGKSSLIKAILGITPLDKGQITIEGKLLDKKTIASLVGYVPQYASFDRDFPISVSEVIELQCLEKHCPIGIEGHLKIFGAEKLMHKRISDLSGGELQKVLIAKALVTNPEIIVLDEPFNNLDHETEADLIGLLQKINRELKKTIILVTHDLGIININEADCLYLVHGKGHWGPAQAVISQHNLKRI